MMRVACFLLLAGLLGPVRAAPKAGCDVLQVDGCAADVFLFAAKDSAPKDAAELESYCKVQKASEECSRNYVKKCTESVVQGIATIFLDDIKDEIDTRCDPTQDYHKEYLKHVGCMNSVGPGIHKCMRDLVVALDVAAQLPVKQRIGGACCKFDGFENCVTQLVQSKCTGESTTFAKGLLNKYAGELLGTVCGAFKGNDKCAAINYGSAVGDASLKSILAPLIKVSDALG
ncbi:uncharacterized protein LOC8041216 [Ixodes scapularis]|uniref:uncharacterized protein LOC8041216 n=1 Tax=Ixodes scapularis TaxID=6945 RepID=UPI001A9F86C1|nr:uncharacterized protein LOC8041216 [Ixodes scapularis]